MDDDKMLLFGAKWVDDPTFVPKVKEVTDVLTGVKKGIDDINKTPIDLTVNDKEIIAKLQAAKDKFQQIFQGIDLSKVFSGDELKEFNRLIQESGSGFRQISIAVEALKQKLASGLASGEIKLGTQQYKDYADAVSAGTRVQSIYNEIVKETLSSGEKVETRFRSMRQRIQDYRNELTKLEDAGKENTKEFAATQLAAAKLQTQYAHMQERVRILASDTRNLDFGIEAIRAATAAYQTYIGVANLFGFAIDKDSEAEKRLLAILNLTVGLQELSNLLKKDGVVQTIGAKLATEAYAAANEFLAESFGAAATAASVFRGVLVTLGIGALIVGLGFLIEKLIEYNEAQKNVVDEQKQLNELVEEADRSAAGRIADLRILTKAAQDQTLSMKERLAAVKQLRKEFPDYFKDLKTEAILTGDINDATDKATASIIELARATAAKGKIDAIEAQRLDLFYQSQKVGIATANELARVTANATKTITVTVAGETQVRTRQATAAEIEADKQLQREKIQQRRDEALADIAAKDAALQRQEDFLAKFAGIGNIAETIEGKPEADKIKKTTDLVFERLREDLLFKIKQLQERVTTESALEFRVREDAAREVANLQIQLSEATLQHEIKIGEDRLLAAQKNAHRLIEIQDELYKSLSKLREEQARQQFEVPPEPEPIQPSAEELRQAQLEAHAKVQKDLLDLIKAAGEDQKNVILANLAEQEQVLIANRRNHLISEREYQKELKRIQKEAQAEMLQALIKNLEAQLQTITDKNSDAFRAVKAQLEQAKVELAALDLTDTSTSKLENFLNQVLSIQQAITGLYTSIAQAEQQSVERSIALQQQRVNNARFIAERGNAEYLQMEQQRLDALQRKQEAAAQRQIAANNAIAVSEALVAIIKSIKEGGVAAPVFVAEAIALIAAGYKFVSSLRPISTTFFEGTPFAQPGRYGYGKDSIPARINAGEAVIPTDTNKAYSEAVKAIYYKTVPPSILNEFVASYPARLIPVTDFARLGSATDFRAVEQADTNKRLDKVHDVLEMIYEATMGEKINVKMDADGFALAISKAARRQWLRKRM